MKIKSIKFFKIIAIALCFFMVFEQSDFAQIAAELDLSSHFARLSSSLIPQATFRPLHLRYLSYDPAANNFNLLLDKGDFIKGQSPSGTDPEDKLQQETKTLLNYFFIGISLPNEAFWVNLRPDSPNNIIDPELAETDVGKILLEADLQLKKDTANFTSPQTLEGKDYWDKLYKKAEELYGNENITIPTLTRPWIVPDEIIIRESSDNAYIYKATLKVMLEQDYLKDSSTYSFPDQRSKALNEYSSQLIRETIIPKLTKEINSSKRYAPLRQVYYSLILAQWFKQKFYGKSGIYSYLIDRHNLNGLTSKTSWSKTTYFNAYKTSFQQGEYNIKEPRSTLYGQSIRSYMSGGIQLGGQEVVRQIIRSARPISNSSPLFLGNNYIVQGLVKVSGAVNAPFDIEKISITVQGQSGPREITQSASSPASSQPRTGRPSLGSIGKEAEGSFRNELTAFSGLASDIKQLEGSMAENNRHYLDLEKQRDRENGSARIRIEGLEGAIEKERRALLAEKNKPWLAWFRNWGTRKGRRNNIKEMQIDIATTKMQLEKQQQEIAQELGVLSSAKEPLQRAIEEKYQAYVDKTKNVLGSILKQYVQVKDLLIDNGRLYSELNEELIAKEIIPGLNELEQKGNISPEQAKEYLALVREQLKEGIAAMYAGSGASLEEGERVRQRSNRIDELNRASGHNLGELGAQIGLQRGIQDKAYGRIIDLLIREHAHQLILDLMSYLKEENLSASLTEKIEEVVRSELGQSETKQAVTRKEFSWLESSHMPAYIERRINEQPEKLPLDISLIPEGILKDYYINESLKQRWGILKHNREIKDMFGEYTFDAAEKIIAKRTVEDLLEAKEHTDYAIDLGYRLFWLAEENPALKIELTPLIIMNSFREPGYSGEYPFLQWVVTDFILSLTESERAALKQKNIPGLIEIIEAVRAYPKTYRGVMIDNPEWKRLQAAFENSYFSPNRDSFRELVSAYQEGREEVIWEKGSKTRVVLSLRQALENACRDAGLQAAIVKDSAKFSSLIDNPISKQIDQNLADMCMTFLQERNENGQYNDAKQFFVMALLRRLGDIDLSRGYPIIEDILRNSRNEKLQQELLEMAAFKSQYLKDPKHFPVVKIVLRSFAHVPEKIRVKIRAIVPQMFYSAIDNEQITEADVGLFVPVFENDYFSPNVSTGEKIQMLKKTILFLNKARKDMYETGYGNFYNSAYLKQYIALANRDEIVQCIADLRPFGYLFSIEHYEALPKIYEQREEIFRELNEIRKIFPDFQYRLFYETADTIYNMNPYDNLMRNYINRGGTLESLLSRLYTSMRERGYLPGGFTDGMQRWLLGKKEKPAKEQQVLFNKAVQALLKNLFGQDGRLSAYQEFYIDTTVLSYLARKPEKIGAVLPLPEATPGLFSLLQIGGPLHANRMLIMQDIFSNDNAVARAQAIESIFTKPTPYWQQLFLFTETRLGPQLRSSTSNYPLTSIILEDGTVLSLASIIKEHLVEKRRNPEAPTQLENMVAERSLIAQLGSGEMASIPFSALSPEYKLWTFRHYLRQTIEISQDEKSKVEADVRNRKAAMGKLSFKEGDYLHGSPVDVIESVLRNGNLPREALGEGAATDSYPFQVDFTRLAKDYIDTHKETEAIITSSLSKSYGSGGLLGGDGQLWYVYHRGKGCWEENKEYGPSTYHSLLLGGMPATEIAAIVLRNPDKTLEVVKKAVIENGFYIPIYSLQGELLFNANEYDSIRLNFNYSAPVEVWDYSLKTGGQQGSNPGAEFTVPADDGPVKYYVKFAQHEEEEHIWVEDLANKIYGALGIPVAETKIVKVAGTYGHASKLLAIDTAIPLDAQRKLITPGFLADALMANWDIPYAVERNTVISGGLLYRIDNGGALLFRARGQRKPEDLFGPQAPVKELEIGNDFERLGYGMRQVYETYGLTPKDIIEQGRLLEMRLTDDAINSLADSIRVSKVDRSYLKDTLKHRRDYILSWVKKNYVGMKTDKMQQQAAGSPIADKSSSPAMAVPRKSLLQYAKRLHTGLEGLKKLNTQYYESLRGENILRMRRAEIDMLALKVLPFVNPASNDITVYYPGAYSDVLGVLAATDAKQIIMLDSNLGENRLALNEINEQLLALGAMDIVRTEKGDRVEMFAFKLAGLDGRVRPREIIYYEEDGKSFIPPEARGKADVIFLSNAPAYLLELPLSNLKAGSHTVMNSMGNGGSVEATQKWLLSMGDFKITSSQKTDFSLAGGFQGGVVVAQYISAGSPVQLNNTYDGLVSRLEGGKEVRLELPEDTLRKLKNRVTGWMNGLEKRKADLALFSAKKQTLSEGDRSKLNIFIRGIIEYAKKRRNIVKPQEPLAVAEKILFTTFGHGYPYGEIDIMQLPLVMEFQTGKLTKNYDERSKEELDKVMSRIQAMLKVFSEVVEEKKIDLALIGKKEEPFVVIKEETIQRALQKATASAGSPVMAEEPVSPEAQKDLAGIDLRSLPKYTKVEQINAGSPVANRALKQGQSPSGTVPVSDKEWQEIERMVNSGIAPSCERLREYLLSLQDPGTQIDRVLACLANILRQEEEKACGTESSLREILVLLESGKPVNELKLALAKIQVLAKEPQLIAQ